MPNPTYHILRVPLLSDHATFVRESGDMEKTWLLGEGESYAKHFPRGAAVDLDKGHKGTKLADFVNNALQWLVVTERVKDVLAKEPVKFEFFPLGIRDKKRKKIAKAYFLANLLGTVDCVDLKKSKFDRSDFEPELVHTFQMLVLDPKRIPAQGTLFRLKEQPTTMIIRSDLVGRLREAGVEGFELWELNSPIVL